MTGGLSMPRPTVGDVRGETRGDRVVIAAGVGVLFALLALASWLGA